MKLKSYTCILAFLLTSFASHAQFSINSSNYISGDENDLPGIDTIFIVQDVGSGLNLNYISADSSNFAWATFKVFSDGTMDFNEVVGAMPLTDNTSLAITEEGGYALLKGSIDRDTFFVWIVDYESHKPTIDSVMVYDDAAHGVDSCKNILLQVYDSRDEIIIGDPKRLAIDTLTRYLRVDWTASPADEVILDKSSITEIAAPVEDTRYTATLKERFLSDAADRSTYLGDVEADTSYTAIAVKYTSIIGDVVLRENVNNEAEQDIGTNIAIEGSAPLDVDFSIEGTSSKVLYYDWYVWKDTESTPSYIRYNTDKVGHEFIDPAENSDTQPDYYVKLVVSNDFCEFHKDSISVHILTSFLDAANVLILGWGATTTEFKAVYKSIKPGTFRGDIFNRWGKRLFSWSDPERGWDGRVNGRYVSPGVYYYVLTATGTDGKKHSVERDLNVLREKGLK